MRDLNTYRQSVLRGQSDFYCTLRCFSTRNGENMIYGDCLQCGDGFTRKPHYHKKERGMFCSTSCSARYRSANRKTSGSACPKCNGPKSYDSTACKSCRQDAFNSRTLGDLRAEYGTYRFHAKLRGLARSAYKGPYICAACGYDLHVDICHIRDVASFPPEATLSEVNRQGNLVALDKRCHWEFDHGFLEVIDGIWVATGKKLVAGRGVEPLSLRL
jgi:hypothetical protein